jgi:SSS family solute:Na+ symporter
VSYSALFIKNLYEPFRPGRSEKHYLIIGRIVIAITLLGGIGVALFINNLLELFKYIISIPAIFGASIWLGFLWRRLTKWAVVVQVVLCLLIYALIPNLFTALNWAKTNETFLKETQVKTVIISTSALHEDVESGRAGHVGQTIKKEHVIQPAGIFFDSVARVDPEDPDSAKVGLGRFHAELWVLSWFGIDFSESTKAQLVAVRFFFDALFPFVLLFLVSFVTKPVRKDYLDRFYAKLHTPVQKTPEEEEKELEKSLQYPDRFKKDKLLPNSNWILVGIIIFLLWLVTSIK